jgi:hypothetical protein
VEPSAGSVTNTATKPSRYGGGMDDDEAIKALISDLHWQIDQLRPRGIKNAAGHPYNPSYYKRGLDNAIARGGLAVADYVRRYVYEPPSDGYT